MSNKKSIGKHLNIGGNMKTWYKINVNGERSIQ